ncbi:MAG: 16S rRNA (uracil(1498)-N(3))-methyltransferase [Persicimonas sp.]
MRRASLDPDQMPPEGRTGGRFSLPESVAHYLRDVLRMEVGAPVELFDGTGRVIVGSLIEVTDNRVTVRIEEDRHTERGESPCEVTLVQAIPKGKRWKMVLEKATELGVDRIVPLESKRTVVDIRASKVDRKLERWERIVDAAARQCERTVTPRVTAPKSLEEALEVVAKTPSIVAHTDGDPPGIAGALDELGSDDGRPEACAVWIGPEGGFTSDEVARLEEAGAQPFHLGPRILRAETAGIIAVGLLQARLGDMK